VTDDYDVARGFCPPWHRSSGVNPEVVIERLREETDPSAIPLSAK